MIVLLWFIVCSFLAAAFLTVSFLIVACFVLLMNWLFKAVSDFGEWRVGVKRKWMVEPWFRSGEQWSNCGSDASRCVRNASKSYETLRTGDDFSGEEFPNTGTFIVVRSSVFALSSGHNTQLARDAHHALWNSRRPGQERNCSPRFKIR